MLVGSEGDTLFVAVAQSGGGHAERMLAVVERYRTRFPAATGVSAL
jgi:hypothetical protein